MSHKTTPAELIHGTSYRTVTEHMQALIAHWEAHSDRRCIFLDCYCRMTSNMQAALTAQRFHDQEWVGRLLHRFAAYYFEALDAYEGANGHSPVVWQLTHDVALQEEASVLQHLLLGVNAHINYDLALALRDLLSPEWDTLSPAARQLRYEDHLLVNQIIAETIDAVQDKVIERHDPGLDLIDRLLGPVDERAIAHIITRWRDDVWETACTLLEAENQEEQEQIRAQLETRSLRRARLMLLP